MATLALSVVGAGLGSYAGIGAGAGWLAGSMLGQVIFAEDSTSGSRLTDLKISGASYGASIPTLFGTMRLGGNVIWAAPLESRASNSGSGGKGSIGSSGGQTSYDYYASFALCLAQGQVGELLKIWADGTVIYDVTDAGESRISGLNFRFYTGSEDQQPDSIIEADLGPGEVPGYRGLSYIVFDTLSLSPYGNRLPNMEALLTTGEVRHYPQQTGSDGYIDASAMAYDPVRGLIYSYEVTGAVNRVRKIDLASLSFVQEAEIGVDFPTLADGMSGFCLDRQGDFWVGTGYGLSPGRKVARFNTGGMIVDTEKDMPTGIGAVIYSVDIVATTTGDAFQVFGSQQNGQVVVFDRDLDLVSWVNVDSLACTGAVRDAAEVAWVAMSGQSAVSPRSDLQIVEISMTSRQGIGGTAFGIGSVVHTIGQTDLTPGGGIFPETNNVTELVALIAQRRLLVFQNDYRIFCWSMDSHTITASRDLTGLGKVSLVNTNDGDSLVYVYGGRWLVYLDAESLAEQEREDLFAFEGISQIDKAVYDGASDSVVITDDAQPLERLYLRRKNGEEAAFELMFEILSEAAGLSLSDVDVSGVSGSVPGYIVNRPMSVQQAMAPLMLAGRIDLSESGYKLKFSPRKQAADITVDESDLLKNPAQTRLQESEMPGSVSLAYMAADGGYLAGSQSAKRSYAPKATMLGRNAEVLDLPMALTAGDAKRICQQNLYDAWTERHSLAAALPLKYLTLDAGDVATVTASDPQTGISSSLTSRLTQSYLGADLSVELEAVQTGAAIVSEDPVADGGSGYQPVLIQRPSNSELFILDLPLLRDEDATAGMGSRYYFAMDGYHQNWRGAGLFRSDSTERFEQVGTASTELAWGVAITALDPTDTPWQTDRDNSLIVRFLNGGDRVESISQTGLLNDGNALLVGEEIINFADVTVLEDGSFLLQTFLRGRRGTEAAMQTHKAGEKVLLLQQDSLYRAVMSLSYLNLPHYWKAVGAGQLIEEVPTQIKGLTGRDLQPYAPVHVKAVRSAESISLTWYRRGRIAAPSLSVNVPVSEMTERYELVFDYDSNSISKYVLDDMSYVYQLADFNENFDVSLLEIPPMTVTVYQLSDAIGRGLPAQENI